MVLVDEADGYLTVVCIHLLLCVVASPFQRQIIVYHSMLRTECSGEFLSLWISFFPLRIVLFGSFSN